MSELLAIHATARRRAPGLRPGPRVRLQDGLPGGGHPLEELLDLLEPAIGAYAGAGCSAPGVGSTGTGALAIGAPPTRPQT